MVVHKVDQNGHEVVAMWPHEYEALKAENTRLGKELAATKRSLARWQYGTQIESDYITASGEVIGGVKNERT